MRTSPLETPTRYTAADQQVRARLNKRRTASVHPVIVNITYRYMDTIHALHEPAPRANTPQREA
jgi:hypothetical protein